MSEIGCQIILTASQSMSSHGRILWIFPKTNGYLVKVLTSIYSIRRIAHNHQAFPTLCTSLGLHARLGNALSTSPATFQSAGWAKEVEGEIRRYLKSLRWVTNGNSFGAYCVDPRLSDQSLGN